MSIWWWFNFLVIIAAATSTTNQYHPNDACNTDFSFIVDDNTYTVTLNGLQPNLRFVAHTLQLQYPNVVSFEKVIYSGMVNHLRELGTSCGDNPSTIYCRCMQEGTSINVQKQPAIAGFCPAYAKSQDYVSVDSVLTSDEAEALVKWAKMQEGVTCSESKLCGDDGSDEGSKDGMKPSYSYFLSGTRGGNNSSTGNKPAFHLLAEIVNVKYEIMYERMRNKLLHEFGSLPISYKDPRMASNSTWFRSVFDSTMEEKARIFIRRYSSESLPSLDWHREACSYGMSIALNNNYVGGELLLALGGDGVVISPHSRLKNKSSRIGHGIGFGPNVPHSVTRVKTGVKWSLVIFLQRLVDTNEFVPCFGSFEMGNLTLQN